MDENDDFDWDAFNKEMEANEQELENLFQNLDTLFDWLDVFASLEKTTQQFNSNMESINQGISLLSRQNKPNENYLNGIFLVGIVSAYESFIHDFFDILCRNQRYISLALVNLDKLSNKDKNHLRLKKNISEDHLISSLKKATLYDSVQVARISEALFDLRIPILKKDHTEKLLEQRNIFTHHGGLSDGKPVEIRLEYVISVYDVILKLINGYINKTKEHADRHLDEKT
ncbi:hypothetical protein [Burkholderia plantarii]|uniref:hypothetical protein n=1 Tax=Burkholderia plantarii TaxID=41899 RepID=UPI000AC1909E|nr:hypothetical protein [Burkholderia plantarii]GLZ21342.1 hypothetical protein Bpla01_48710 [Burkholderia plantarii]